MSWEECVANIKNSYKPKPVMEISEVSWSTVDQTALDNNSFKDGNPFFLICPGRHCIDYVNTTPADHALCQCKTVEGKDIPGCTPPSYLYPEKASVCLDINDINNFNAKSGRTCTRQGESWYELTCYCCCSCFAHGTRIGVPDGFKVIEQFQVGDHVLTANVVSSGAGLALSWSPAALIFSSGTGPDSYQPVMVFIHHGEVGTLIVTPDHLFLLATGKLKRADRLVPGHDQLVTADGQPVAINEVSLGEYHGGVHHIATDKAFTGDLDGHLLISEGVVSGDFNLQIHAPQLKERYFVDDHDSLPKIGSDEYDRTHSHLASDVYPLTRRVAATGNAAPAPARPQKFYVHGQNVTTLPDTAASYLSPDQAESLKQNADQLGFAEMNIGSAAVQYVLKLFQGFYPDIVFYHEAGRLETNAYAFTQYGKQVILLSGGLTRINGLGLEGYALILSHLVTRLQGSSPRDAHGYTSVGMADYYSPLILRNVFFGPLYTQMFSEGLSQVVNAVFSKIDAADDTYEGDPFAPSRETRVAALNAGDSMHYPPVGIGGPVEGALQVMGATTQPPRLQPSAFVTEDIVPDMAAQVYADLQQQKLLDQQGTLTAEVGLDTDLAFLFGNAAESLKRLLIEEVRYVLLHVRSSVQVRFNLPVNASSAATTRAYSLEPQVTISAAQVSAEGTTVTLQGSLKPGVVYTLDVAASVRAADGSTLDPDASSATFELAQR